ncbi:YqzE family protein [Pradoshia sp. D12]|uniref:YqzE family protein n=2 Tax=Bacillaceae TaxID=186817 RepID=UPI001CEF6D9D|nr:YqzE family protein [Pradoshia sp. D12]
MSMKTNDYIKFLTIQWLVYMKQPKEVRKEQRRNHRDDRPPLMNHWFGIIPLSIEMLFKRKA